MADEPRKRSRFDQTEPPRKTRFDQRSRSPKPRDSDEGSRRERSPMRSHEDPIKSAQAKAAEVAARVNAMHAKKGIQHVDVPPIRKPSSPNGSSGASKSPAPPASLNSDIYTQDGDFIKDIEVNDLRNRYTLTKGSTQKLIKEKTGADVTTRGSFYPD
ncbi:hypothetical protein M433DRAFT_154929, partial [Acidomyces richmondensis BFW]